MDMDTQHEHEHELKYVHEHIHELLKYDKLKENYEKGHQEHGMGRRHGH
jgi:hypothetical protein